MNKEELEEYKPITKEELEADYQEYLKDCAKNLILMKRMCTPDHKPLGFFKWFFSKFKK